VANARIQFAFDLLNEQVVYLSVDPYRLNDIKKARCLKVNPRDLVLRDRGYLSTAEITRIVGAQADFIYRYKHGLLYLDVRTGKPIALLTMLKRNPSLDIVVRLSDKQGPVVRLVATAVNGELANRRRQKLKKQAHGKPSQECLALLSWSIFITSITTEQMDYKAVQQLYTLRWRVEILFKVMKSNLQLDKIHTIPAHQLHFIIYAKLIFFILITCFIYLPARQIIDNHFNKDLSITKLTTFIIVNLTNMNDILQELFLYDQHPQHYLNLLARYCCYDKRKRTNYHQSAKHIFLS
jgi:hypothetical protein